MKLTLFFVGSSWYFKVVANSIKSNKSWVSRKKLNVNETKQEETTNKEKMAGLLDVILELRSSKLTSLEPQMILAGNQSKQREPLHIIIRILHHFYVFSIIKIYLFIFQTSRIFIPLLVFSLLRYSLLVTALLCLVTPHYVFRMLISNVQKSVIVINSIETRFSRNWMSLTSFN